MIKLKTILNEVLSEKADPKVLDAIETIMNNKAGSIRRKAIGAVLAAAKARTGESPRTLKQALQFLDLEESTLKEMRPPGKISGEPADEQSLSKEQIEADMKAITGQNVRVKKKGNFGEWKVEWSYMRRQLPSDKWNKALKHITDVYGAYIDKEWTRNDYEANYEPEEPAEWTPSIYFEEA